MSSWRTARKPTTSSGPRSAGVDDPEVVAQHPVRRLVDVGVGAHGEDLDDDPAGLPGRQPRSMAPRHLPRPRPCICSEPKSSIAAAQLRVQPRRRAGPARSCAHCSKPPRPRGNPDSPGPTTAASAGPGLRGAPPPPYDSRGPHTGLRPRDPALPSRGDQSTPGGFLQDDLTPTEVERQAAALRPPDRRRARAGRRDDPHRGRRRRDPRRQAEVEALTARLRARSCPARTASASATTGSGRAWGNAVVGLRNPVAPPLVVEHDPSGRRPRLVRLPPRRRLRGPADARARRRPRADPRPDARRVGRRRRTTRHDRHAHAALPPATPLGRPARRGLDRPGRGHQDLGQGPLLGPDGVTVEAEGVFILPRWARDLPPARGTGPLRVAAAATSPGAVEAGSRLGRQTLTPRSPLSVSRASSAAWRLELRAPRAARPRRRSRRGRRPGRRRRRRSAPSAARAKICCSVAVRSERPRPRNETNQCSTAVTPVLEAGDVDEVDRRATSARR